VVGDPRQTIFSFTGATPAYLTGFAAEFPDATVIRLVRNYRSTPQVLTLANRISGSFRGPPGRSRSSRSTAMSKRRPRGWRGAPPR
jgi:DNA helicase II / ATP-dependent DNA helicase PcrA